MEQVTAKMETVAGFEDAGSGADPVLTLADGTRCTLGRQDARFAVWQRIVESSRSSGLPVYVERLPVGAAKAILPVAARRIRALAAEAGEDRLPVSIAGSPARHFLRTTRADYAELRSLLQGAAEDQGPLLLAVEPATLEILAARPPAEGAKVVVI